jgi:hypothetical protein
MLRNKLQLQTLEGRALCSTTPILAAVETTPAQVRTQDDWEFAASKEGSDQDAVFIKEVDPRPADEIGAGLPTGRDDPFFRGGEYMWTPADLVAQKVTPADPVMQKVTPIKEVDPVAYMW